MVLCCLTWQHKTIYIKYLEKIEWTGKKKIFTFLEYSWHLFGCNHFKEISKSFVKKELKKLNRNEFEIYLRTFVFDIYILVPVSFYHSQGIWSHFNTTNNPVWSLSTPKKRLWREKTVYFWTTEKATVDLKKERKKQNKLWIT